MAAADAEVKEVQSIQPRLVVVSSALIACTVRACSSRAELLSVVDRRRKKSSPAHHQGTVALSQEKEKS
jgi:hypothetical protein